MTVSVFNPCPKPTPDGIDALRTLRRGPNSSGYRNVYFAGLNNDKVAVWKARVKRGGVLSELPGSRSTEPRVSARCVVAWYRQEYGPNWEAVLRVRKVNAFQVRASKSHGGYIAAVWVLGNRDEVWVLRRRRRDRWVPTDSLAVFPDRKAAKAGKDLYLRRLYGLCAPFMLYRSAPAVRQK